jgi:predicted amidophosphoribosyltransferase
MQLISGAAYADHYFLNPQDECWFLGGYCRGSRGRDEAVGRLIRQLKWQSAPEARHEVLCDLARRLRAAIDRSWVEGSTWVPQPSSRGKNDLTRMLQLAFEDYDLDVRAVLRLDSDGVADRWRDRRLSLVELWERMSVDSEVLGSQPMRRRIVLFDDVLTSGKHYCCARQRLAEACLDRPVCGVFLARRVPRAEPGSRLPHAR